jgi:dipeptidase D
MKTYLDFFKEISAIPRKSGKEDKIADYLVNFAEERDLRYYRDEINNVIIWKEASTGYENRKILALQSHVDMICEKDSNIEHNFLTDPLNIYIDGDFVKARGTTLGADNGVGVAYMLAILDSKEIQSPKLECIFTVQEETTMNGARLIDVTKILSNQIISFDNFSENEMWVSSANSKEWVLKIDTEYEILSKDYYTYELSFSNFKGGHSGLDIGDEERINPIKLGIELIKDLDVYINKIDGGSRVNIIPRDFKVVFSSKEDIENIKFEVEKLINKSLYGEIEMNKCELQKKCFSKELTNSIIRFIYNYKNGVISRDKEDNIILSANMGAVETKENEVLIKCSLRANEKILGENLRSEIESNILENDIKVKFFDEMLGYFPQNNSELAERCAKLYKETFDKEIRRVKVQACLECGFFAGKIKDLEYISIAPNIYNAHSPDEKFSISSADRMWRYIVSILKF